ncbi:hypothetical protein [Propioniciclava soli]|uniref:hypothetical protein n=1 Tax=Propioniciclava soli TaxID=2775081 RepID=UPI001E61D895|nr:hypothetical protein [Propioniciclava soli]
MPDQQDANEIAANLRAALTGAEPPADLLDQLGGEQGLATLAPTLVDDPLLTPALSLLAREAGRATEAGGDLTSIRSAAAALAAAALDSKDPAQFASNIEILCADAVLPALVGDQVAASCLKLATPPRAAAGGEEMPEAQVLRQAIALESVGRLVVRGHGSKYKLLALLEDVKEPQPRRYAQAVARIVTLAFDHWETDDDVADVLDILTGVVAPANDAAKDPGLQKRNDELRRDIAPDALWAKSNVALAQALRSTTKQGLCNRLDDALEHLQGVTQLDDRSDAELLRAALKLLRGLLGSLDDSTGSQDAATWEASLTDAASMAARADQFTFDTHGLNHWSGDRKLAVLLGWRRLANDLAFLKDQLSRDSIYEAALVLDDILAIYASSRSYDVTSRAHGAENVLATIRPSIASGFAARAGLLRNLIDHTEVIRHRIEAAQTTDDIEGLRRRLTTAETVLQAARASLAAGAEPPGKQHERAADLPPLLADLLGPTPTVIECLQGADPAELEQLAAAVADLQAATDLDPDIMVTSTRKRILAALSSSEDFRDDVVPAVTVVLDQLIKFVRQRVNNQSSWKSYQFDPEADEHALHVDLYEWLCQGQFGSFTNVEVQEVGAGRVDIQIQFSGFHLYLELKADDTAVPVSAKAAYIKQTVSYQASDVRIGFLVVLRMTHPKNRSPSAHLTEFVSHTTVAIDGSDTERHVVMLEIPGNQTKPSAVR